jgi:hypothetical protein
VCFGSGYSRFSGEFGISEKFDLIFMAAVYYDDESKVDKKQCKLFKDDSMLSLTICGIVWIQALSFDKILESFIRT